MIDSAIDNVAKNPMRDGMDSRPGKTTTGAVAEQLPRLAAYLTCGEPFHGPDNAERGRLRRLKFSLLFALVGIPLLFGACSGPTAYRWAGAREPEGLPEGRDWHCGEAGHTEGTEQYGSVCWRTPEECRRYANLVAAEGNRVGGAPEERSRECRPQPRAACTALLQPALPNAACLSNCQATLVPVWVCFSNLRECERSRMREKIKYPRREPPECINAE